jgi:murein L,D-transpeptidase YafK
VIAAICAIALAGCIAEGATSPTFGPKHLQPVSASTMALIASKGMDLDSPILLRIFKEENELEIWKQARDGKYALLKTYPICKWSGELGPKIRQGDRQAPEGFYHITPELMNPRSSYHLAFNLGYPNEFDRAHGRTGSHLMVHGDCSSAGCYAMTDEQVQEIYALSRESFDGGQLAFQVQAFPFRMTAKNMARHRKNPHMPFWRMLKEGYDHFELTKQAPKVDVCEKRYVFNAHLLDPSQPFDPVGKCPEYEIPEAVAVAAREKRNSDDQSAKLLSNLVPAAPVTTGLDGGTHEVFANGSQPANMSTPAVAATPARESVTGSTPRAAAAASAPQASPRRSEPTQTATLNGRRPAPRSEPEDEPEPVQQRPAQPQTLPGTAPIRSTGGFSYR